MADHDSSPLARNKSSRSSFCCFNLHGHQAAAARPRLVRTPSHLKEKCSNFISRIGRHSRRHSADFHYDALSYSMNFEDDSGAADDDRYLDNDFRCFSARLPPSPTSRTTY